MTTNEIYLYMNSYSYEVFMLVLKLNGLDCANCAKKIEDEVLKIEGVSQCNVDFISQKMQVETTADCIEEIKKIVLSIEPDVKVEVFQSPTFRYRISGLDCANCASKLEQAYQKIPNVDAVHLDFLNQTLTIQTQQEKLPEVFSKIVEITNQMEEGVEITSEQIEEESEDQRIIYRLLIGACLFLVGLFLQGNLKLIVEIFAYLILGYDVIFKAMKNIGRGQLFDEHFLMSLATICAIFLQEYSEAAGVMLFYQIGEYFQDKAVDSSRKSIRSLLNLRPDTVTVFEQGNRIVKPLETVKVGEYIEVLPSEKIGLDGEIVEGSTSLDTSSLTGESKPYDVEVGDSVQSGCINQTGRIVVRVTKLASESTVSRILELVEHAQQNKAQSERFITKFSRYYTPIVVTLACLIALLLPLLGYEVTEGIRRACAFLVISCPCALVISVPLSFFAGIGSLSKHGVLVKGANTLEALSKIKQVIFDKTGTLTTGAFVVDTVIPSENQNEVLKYASIAEQYSTHPLAQAIKQSYPITQQDVAIEQVAGKGIIAHYGTQTIYVGNRKLLLEHGIEVDEAKVNGTLCYVGKDQSYLGCIVLKDQIKENAITTIQRLKSLQIQSGIVSGDDQTIVSHLQQQLQVDLAKGNCLPQDKVQVIQQQKQPTAFVGDGVNDAPVLVTSEVGFAMGALGSDAAIEASDVVIMDDDIEKVVDTIEKSKQVVSVATQNIVGAIVVKVIILALGALGYANMWMAIFGDTGVALLCVLNAIRLLKNK